MTDKKGARYFSLLGLGFIGCTSLTSVDWSLIPAPVAAAGTSASGGTNATAGGPSEAGEPAGGQAGQGGVPSGAAGQGEAGYAGELGGAPPETGGTETGGTNGGSAGSGGVGGGGAMGGVAGSGTGGGGAGGSGGGATTLCTAYPTTPLATSFTGKIVLFDAGTKPPNAAWGGRAGIDAACKTAAQALGLTKKTVHALAVDNTEEAINTAIMGNYAEAFGVPTDLNIVSKFGIVLGQWSDFAQSPIKSFICAGVVHDDVTEWFSGVMASGDVDPTNNCSAWAFGDDSVATRAAVGRTDTTARVFHENWLSDHWVSCASTTAHALCLAWGD